MHCTITRLRNEVRDDDKDQVGQLTGPGPSFIQAHGRAIDGQAGPAVNMGRSSSQGFTGNDFTAMRPLVGSPTTQGHMQHREQLPPLPLVLGVGYPIDPALLGFQGSLLSQNAHVGLANENQRLALIASTAPIPCAPSPQAGPSREGLRMTPSTSEDQQSTYNSDYDDSQGDEDDDS